jgi:hypothetical protein
VRERGELPEEEEGMEEERGEKKWGCAEEREDREIIVYNLIFRWCQQCFPMHWETLLKPNGLS